MYSIGEVGRRVGLAPSAIRFYEAQGLLAEPMRQGGKRRYTDDVFPRLDVIRMCQDAGFTLAETKTIVRGLDSGRRGPKKLRELAVQKLPEMENQLRTLRLMHRFLTAAASCECPDLSTCADAARRAGLGRPRTGPAPGPSHR